MLTVDEWAAEHGNAARTFEAISSVFFIGEYACRLWVAGERLKYYTVQNLSRSYQ